MDPNQNPNPNQNPTPAPEPQLPPLPQAPEQTQTPPEPVVTPLPQSTAPTPPQPPSVSSPATPTSEPVSLPFTPVPEPAQTSSEEPGLIRAFIGGLFSWFIIPIGIVLVLHLFVFQAFHVVGNSMIPTLKDADYLIISKLGQTAAMAQEAVGRKTDYIPPRNEIVVFRYPKDPSLVFVKRVIGLPGDRVVVSNGKVRVYTKKKPEGFDPTEGYEVSSQITLIDTDITVPPHNVFVLGDNRQPNGSSDSRDWGTLPTDHIIGNAIARLIPIDKAQLF